MVYVLLACVGAPKDSPVEGDADVDADADADSDADSDSQTDTQDSDTAPVPCEPTEEGQCAEDERCCTPCCLEDATPICTAPDVFGECPTPDVSIDEGRLSSSVMLEDLDFEEDDCAVVEGCVTQPGLRRVLRFTTSTPNLGTGDLALGIPEEHPDQFGWSECHQHYHYDGYAAYDMLDEAGASTVTGRKQAFCLQDSEPITATGLPHYNCGDQGISVGWADNYASSLDCQWIDVTDLPGGSYTLRVTLDPNLQLVDRDRSNNIVEVIVSLPEPTEPPSCPP